MSFRGSVLPMEVDKNRQSPTAITLWSSPFSPTPSSRLFALLYASIDAQKRNHFLAWTLQKSSPECIWPPFPIPINHLNCVNNVATRKYAQNKPHQRSRPLFCFIVVPAPSLLHQFFVNRFKIRHQSTAAAAKIMQSFLASFLLLTIF